MVLRRDDDYAAAGKPACDYGDPAARGELVDALARDARALLAALDGPTAGPQARHGRRTRHRGFDGYQGHIAIDLDARTVTCPAGDTMRIRAGGVTVTLARPGSGSSAPRARWLTGAPPLGRAAPLPSARTRPGWPPPARPRPAQPGRLATKQPAQGGAQDRPPHAPAQRRAPLGLAWRYALGPSTWAAPHGPPVVDAGPRRPDCRAPIHSSVHFAPGPSFTCCVTFPGISPAPMRERNAQANASSSSTAPTGIGSGGCGSTSQDDRGRHDW